MTFELGQNYYFGKASLFFQLLSQTQKLPWMAVSITFLRIIFIFPLEEKLTGWLMNCHTSWLALRETYEKAVKRSVSDFLGYEKEHWNLVVIQRLLSLGKIKSFRNILNETENSNCPCPVYSSSFFPWATCLFSFPHVFQELMVTHQFGEKRNMVTSSGRPRFVA